MNRRAANAVTSVEPIRILLIEDDEDDYVLTRELLGETETLFALDWCSSVDAAREALRRGEHDVCLLDYRLGEHSGMDLLREAHAAGCAVPIIVFTGQGNREIDVEAMRAGAAYYLAKADIDAPSLERTIRYALELRRAEVRARDSETRVRAILEHAVDGIITIDEEGRIESFNPAAARLFGYTAQEMTGATIGMLMTETDRVRHGRRLAEYRATGYSRIIGRSREVIGRRKDGSQIPIELAVSEMVLHGTRRFIGTLHDISERKRTEAALRESEQRLQLSVDAAGVALWDWDLAGGRVYYSPQWKAQLGYADEELANDATLWESLLHPDDRARCTARLRRALKRSVRPYEDEFRLRHRDGSYRWISSRGTIYRGADGRAVRMIGAHIDITERRATEETVRQLNAELEQRVAERTAQLAAANQELEAFSYSVSHDLRAPLRSIDGFAQALIEDHAGALPESAHRYLDRVRAAAQRMSGLIDDLLQLARVTRGDLRRRPIDLSQLAREIAHELCQKAPERAVAFEIQPGLVVDGDPILLRQALDNLLGNAWKYTSRRNAARIVFAAEARDAGLVYFVRDDGAGFDPAYTSKLFRPFQRLHNSPEFEGTGIGLATVQRIIHRHGGQVWAESAVDAGATFYFTLA